ncbi:Smr/MutS family protein [Mesorhizobium sp. CAU 1741]|uniref:Smr/MutS family protein n=1 Tax=Mesorhizobium sp. CAU 1741 TaxID=3140366 RepID=UPI00325B8613
MARSSDRKLSAEDRILWGKVARSVTPMPGKALEDEFDEPEEFAQLLDAPPPAPARPSDTQPSRQRHPDQPRPQHGIDLPTRTKLAKGRLPIEGKVDLHGLTQSEAHALLLSFLHRAHADGRRHVLVVTGKGSSLGSDGVLRRAVPAWFATPAFRGLVGGYEAASRRHGGGGAIYVRLRRAGGV